MELTKQMIGGAVAIILGYLFAYIALLIVLMVKKYMPLSVARKYASLALFQIPLSLIVIAGAVKAISYLF